MIFRICYRLLLLDTVTDSCFSVLLLLLLGSVITVAFLVGYMLLLLDSLRDFGTDCYFSILLKVVASRFCYKLLHFECVTGCCFSIQLQAVTP